MLVSWSFKVLFICHEPTPGSIFEYRHIDKKIPYAMTTYFHKLPKCTATSVSLICCHWWQAVEALHLNFNWEHSCIKGLDLTYSHMSHGLIFFLHCRHCETIYLFLLYLKLSQSESTSSTNFSVIFEGWASNNWSQRSSNWSWSNGAGFLYSVVPSPLLSHGLVEPCLHSFLPVFVEMPIGNNVIPFGGHGC